MFNFIKYSFSIRYLAFLIIIIIYSVNSKSATFNDIFSDIQENYYSINTLCYDLTIIKKESNKNVIIYKGNTYEEWDKKNKRHYVFIRFVNNQILLSYDNNLGINRYWFGSNVNLPEIKSINIDSKILDTSITYSTFLINPLWLTIPYKSRLDHGFLVITAKNKNKFSNLSKIDFYINKNNVPIRILYYNNISDLPVIEIIIKHYKIFNEKYLIDDLIYKDNLNKIYTEIKKTNFKFNQDVILPIGFNMVKEIIEKSININYKLYLNSIINNNIETKNKVNEKIELSMTNPSEKDGVENKSNSLLLKALKNLEIKKKSISSRNNLKE